MSSNDTILTMENITKTFGPVKALTDVNLSVDRGEIHAICGENGAGKSTLMNVLSGVYPYGSYSGKITFDGKECPAFLSGSAVQPHLLSMVQYKHGLQCLYPS